MGVNKLKPKEIKKIPQLMGEVDVIRTLTLLPWCEHSGRGASGFNVRGGNVDQNLILGDEAPVFNSSHLLGFFSIFNADAVKDMKLYKGGVPANYGGRCPRFSISGKRKAILKGLGRRADWVCEWPNTSGRSYCQR